MSEKEKRRGKKKREGKRKRRGRGRNPCTPS